MDSVSYHLISHLFDEVVIRFGLPKTITALMSTRRTKNPEGSEDYSTAIYNMTMDDYGHDQYRAWLLRPSTSYSG